MASGRGIQLGFVDALQSLLPDIMAVAASQDADIEFLVGLRDAILARIGYQQQRQQVEAAEKIQSEAGAGMEEQAAAAMPMDPGGGAPMEPPSVNGGPPSDMSRGPTPGADLKSATSELERIMAGS